MLAPLTNRATEGDYPTGSTFKIITALAALESGVITPSTTSSTTAARSPSATRASRTPAAPPTGRSNLAPALEVSSDVYFYELGLEMWKTNELQDWAHKLGIGRPTGLDLPGKTEGLVPSKQLAQPALQGRTKPNAPGRPATTSSWRPARATCRPTRCSWRSPTPRSATAARSSPRTWAWKSRTPPAGC